MPELLDEGLPAPASRSRFEFTQWADGRAWRFVKGDDYDSTTDTFRSHVKRWAKRNGYEVELRTYPALDEQGNLLPATKADPIALGVQFTAKGKPRARTQTPAST